MLVDGMAVTVGTDDGVYFRVGRDNGKLLALFHLSHDEAANLRDMLGAAMVTLTPAPLPEDVGTTKDGHPKHPLYLRADCETVVLS